ncbi:avidin-related protein 4/5-like [Branchiostoma floridae x Branchiostoma japonicum]
MRLCLLLFVTVASASPANGQADVSDAPSMSNGTDANPCEDITGLWYNNLGSQMTLVQNGTIITGFYGTAVESTEGAAGYVPPELLMSRPVGNPHGTFAWIVIWSNGRSTTAWTAQCVICGDHAELHTTWLLRTKVDGCDDRWKATRVGEDTFTRYSQTEIEPLHGNL